MKVRTDPLLAELWPDGTFGKSRPRRRKGEPDPDAQQHFADLTAEVARMDAERRARRHSRPAA